jgi:hypothetical protein
MRPLLPIIAALALASAAHGAPDAGELLTPESAAGEWRPLIAALASKESMQATFTEHRYFPFRREPMALKGVLRISPDRGVSLQYTDPEPNVLIADATGLILRDKSGRSREISASSREGGAIASLLPIMRFDLPELFPRFVIRARRTESGWEFQFTPRDAANATSLGSITLAGSGTDVRHLEFKRSESQRVEIDVSETRNGAVFTPAEQAHFFR